MRPLALEFLKAALAALILVGAACTPSTYARSDRSAVASAQPVALGSTESSAPDTPVVAAQGHLSEPEPQPVAPLDGVQANSERAGDKAAGDAPAIEKKQVEGVAQTPSQARIPIATSSLTPELPELWRLDRGPGEVALIVPRNETLVYEVHLNLGWLGSPDVGKVTMTSEVRPYYSEDAGGAIGEQAQLSGRAEGGYKVYTLDNKISATLLPQAWPRLVHRNIQTGSENRIRELWFGDQDDKETSRYRADTHCKGCTLEAHFVSGSMPWSDDHHCKKCKRAEHRVWRDARSREIPAGTLDMMSAVYLARSLVIDGRDRIVFPLVDRNDLWQVQLTRGKSQVIETSAGKFNTVAIELRSSPPEGQASNEATKFEGLFGIHGTISIWMEANSGVPVRIDGQVPAGPIDLDATVELRSASGTPRSFTVLR